MKKKQPIADPKPVEVTAEQKKKWKERLGKKLEFRRSRKTMTGGGLVGGR